jgi:hypothetical protein
MAASVSPSLLLLPILPRSAHKYLPVLRWKYPFYHIPKKLPYEFFFYAARRGEAPLSTPARRIRKLHTLNRILLLLQTIVWIPLYLGSFPWELGRDQAKIPGTQIKLPLPDIKGWMRDESETSWGKIKERAKRRLQVEIENEGGKVVREYYDPNPKSIVGKSFRQTFEYLGEFW